MKTENEKPKIAVIDGLFCPFSDQIDHGPRGAERRITIFWGIGYPTFELARKAIEIVTFGGTNPSGILIDQNSGKRI